MTLKYYNLVRGPRGPVKIEDRPMAVVREGGVLNVFINIACI